MKIGIPKGLLNQRYLTFFCTFFEELGAEVIVSGETNTNIFDEGIKYCVDEACLPIKVFHGHVAALKDKCDLIFVPRIMQLKEREYICPKFCGLPEMIINSIPNLPPIITSPIYAYDKRKIFEFAKIAAKPITSDKGKIKRALLKAIDSQISERTGLNQEGYKLKVGLLGHPYNIYDSFVNMNVQAKLNKLGTGIITEENVEEFYKDNAIKLLYKRPFWAFTRGSFGTAVHLAKENVVQGIVYISSFACGIDSILIELIKSKIDNFPMLILKIDEQTGEAGVDTRLEAFIDMLERSGKGLENNIS